VNCHYCKNDAVYKCAVCGRLLCGEHAHLRTVCPNHQQKAKTNFTITPKRSVDEKSIRKLVETFWGEQEQLSFNKKFNVAELPGYVAKIKDKIVGFVSATKLDNNTVIVALGVLPLYQASGIGKCLIARIEHDASGKGSEAILVSTSNDDLPALGFYQSLGFQIYDVKPDVIAQKHGKVMLGIGNLPVRDELRLRKNLAG